MTTTFDLISLFDYVLTLSIVKTKKKKKTQKNQETVFHSFEVKYINGYLIRK